MTLFSRLVELLEDFQVTNPFLRESDLENDLANMLRAKHISIKIQHSVRRKRYDIICSDYIKNESVCIELKTKCDTSNVKQFDRYIPDFPDGFIVACWTATNSMRDIFADVEKQSKTPVRLIEIGRGASIV